jgi:hypothetical protein
MVAASIGPTPGTLRNSATFSRQRVAGADSFVQLVFERFDSHLEPGDGHRFPHESMSVLVADDCAQQ